ncbi:MAG: hypothetical protein HY812_19240 [Planctomycetes bacterium]|nr:hypothetical protein [Planctomycetota bacterium]
MHSRSISLFLVLFAALLGAVVVNEVFASVPTIRGKGRVKQELEFLIPFLQPSALQVVYTVPAGKTFVITDMVVTNDSTTTPGLFNIFDELFQPLNTFVRVTAGNTTHLAYLTGIAVAEGRQVHAGNTGFTVLHVRLAGYLR